MDKINIPLNSPLDANSRDMLVSMDKPKFSYNRQKHLGSLLQSSMRFEKDGWFAGWYGHQFNIESDREDLIFINDEDKSENFNVRIYNVNGVRVFKLEYADDTFNFEAEYIPEAFIKNYLGENSITRDGDTVLIECNTDDGDHLLVKIDVETGHYIDIHRFNPVTTEFDILVSDEEFVIRTSKKGVMYRFVLYSSSVSDDNSADIVFAKPSYFLEQKLQYTLINGLNKWSIGIEADNTLDNIVSTTEHFEVQGSSVINKNELNEVLSVDLKSLITSTVTLSILYNIEWRSLIHTSIRTATKQISIAGPGKCNTQKAFYVENNGNDCTFAYQIPIWLTALCELGYEDSIPTEVQNLEKHSNTLFFINALYGGKYVEHVSPRIQSINIIDEFTQPVIGTPTINNDQIINYTDREIGGSLVLEDKGQPSYHTYKAELEPIMIPTDFDPFKKCVNQDATALPRVFNSSLNPANLHITMSGGGTKYDWYKGHSYVRRTAVSITNIEVLENNYEQKYPGFCEENIDLDKNTYFNDNGILKRLKANERKYTESKRLLYQSILDEEEFEEVTEPQEELYKAGTRIIGTLNTKLKVNYTVKIELAKVDRFFHSYIDYNDTINYVTMHDRFDSVMRGHFVHYHNGSDHITYMPAGTYYKHISNTYDFSTKLEDVRGCFSEVVNSNYDFDITSSTFNPIPNNLKVNVSSSFIMNKPISFDASINSEPSNVGYNFIIKLGGSNTTLEWSDVSVPTSGTGTLLKDNDKYQPNRLVFEHSILNLQDFSKVPLAFNEYYTSYPVLPVIKPIIDKTITNVYDNANKAQLFILKGNPGGDVIKYNGISVDDVAQPIYPPTKDSLEYVQQYDFNVKNLIFSIQDVLNCTEDEIDFKTRIRGYYLLKNARPISNSNKPTNFTELLNSIVEYKQDSKYYFGVYNNTIEQDWHNGIEVGKDKYDNARYESTTNFTLAASGKIPAVLEISFQVKNKTIEGPISPGNIFGKVNATITIDPHTKEEFIVNKVEVSIDDIFINRIDPADITCCGITKAKKSITVGIPMCANALSTCDINANNVINSDISVFDVGKSNNTVLPYYYIDRGNTNFIRIDKEQLIMQNDNNYTLVCSANGIGKFMFYPVSMHTVEETIVVDKKDVVIQHVYDEYPLFFTNMLSFNNDNENDPIIIDNGSSTIHNKIQTKVAYKIGSIVDRQSFSNVLFGKQIFKDINIDFEEIPHTDDNKVILRLRLKNNNYIDIQYTMYDDSDTTFIPTMVIDDLSLTNLSFKGVLDSDYDGLKIKTLSFDILSDTVYTIDLYRQYLANRKGLMSNINITDLNGSVNILSDEFGSLDTASKGLTNSNIIYLVNYIDISDLYHHFAINKYTGSILEYVPTGIVKHKNDNFSYIDDIHFTVDRRDIIVQLDSRSSFEYSLDYVVTDIRNGEEKLLHKRNLEDINMFVKQFWSNDVSTENFWWINENYILAFEKYDAIIYEKIPNEYDHWNGNKWTKHLSLHKSLFTMDNPIHYMVTSGYNEDGLFVKLIPNGNNIVIRYCNLLDMSIYNNNSINFEEVIVPINNIKIGTPIGINGIYVYGNFTAHSLLSTSSISMTHTKQSILIGIANTKGIKQWTITIQNGSFSVLTGFGHVGVDGKLTGNVIPDYCCGVNGFNTTVQPISYLKDIVEGENAVVGTDSAQWFISSSILRCVSHYTFNGSFIPEYIPLRSNYAEQYVSTSFNSDGFYDFNIDSIGITTLFGDKLNGAAKAVINLITPTLYIMRPSASTAVYINHTVGQYAYTWRNYTQLTEHAVPGNVPDRDTIFLTKEKRINMILKPGNHNIFFDLLMKAVQFSINTAADYTVNKVQGHQTTADGVGRRFGSFFVENAASTVGNAIMAKGTGKNMSSVLRWFRSLDMCYSINDRSQFYCGPGFANYNTQAQCIAQSVTDTQLSANKTTLWMSLSFLSIGIEKLKLYAMQKAKEALINQASMIKEAAVMGSNIGSAIAAGLVIAAIAVDATITGIEVGIEFLESMSASVGGKPAESWTDITADKYDTDIEGTHSYGNKSVSLFYPAFGVTELNTMTVETVNTHVKRDESALNIQGKSVRNEDIFVNHVESVGYEQEWANKQKGVVVRATMQCYSDKETVQLPQDMAIIEGTDSFLPSEGFRNEQIGVAKPVFPPPPVHDYIIDKEWNLGLTGAAGHIISVSCGDTKLVDGPPSNMIITDDFCGIASSYIAMEVKRGYKEEYLRPVAVTPNTIALNIDGVNCVHDAKVYHAFDGQMNRIVNWKGGAGLDKELLFQQYLFQINDHFKRSNILPPSQFFGNFNGPPNVAIRSSEQIANIVQELTTSTGTSNDIPGEQKNLKRFSAPIFSEQINTLPAMIRMLAPYKLHVVEGVTSLCTDIRTTQTAYKAPTSVDFDIYGNSFRANDEYISVLKVEKGIVAVKDIIAVSGLIFIGATTKQAFFYSPATRLYYSFKGGQDISKQDVMNRFRNITVGRWDFVNQEVLFSCDLNGEVVICRLDENIGGEVYPPIKTIYSDESWFKMFSAMGGFIYQGPKRYIVNRFITKDNMIEDIIKNKRKWHKVNREVPHYYRRYELQYTDIFTQGTVSDVIGWTHNPFLLVTCLLGVDPDTDCKFEWSMTFAWTPEMEKIFEINEYVTVNIMAETVTQGGKVLCRPTHLYLYKELFYRTNNSGYYTFKFQSNNGVGNRERLFIWSDGYIALSDLNIHYTQTSTNRAQPLVQDVDVQQLTEM